MIKWIFPKSFDNYTMDELETLKYQIEDVWADKNLINEWIKEKI